MNHIEKIEEIIEAQNGTVLSSDLNEYGIPRAYLSMMVVPVFLSNQSCRNGNAHFKNTIGFGRKKCYIEITEDTTRDMLSIIPYLESRGQQQDDALKIGCQIYLRGEGS